METQPVVKGRAKPFSSVWLASLGAGILAVLVVVFLLRSASSPSAKSQVESNDFQLGVDQTVQVAAVDAGQSLVDAGTTMDAQGTERSKPKTLVRKRPPKATQVAQPKAIEPIVVRPTNKASGKVGESPKNSALPLLEKRDLDAPTMRDFQLLNNCRQGKTGIEISLHIHKNGMPFSVHVTGASKDVSSCLRKVVRKWRYPEHSGSAVRHKINF